MKPYFAFQWHITDACDQRCKHCYIFAENTAKEQVSMDLDHMMRVVDNCLHMCQTFDRSPYLYLTGGDPLLHPHFWDLLARLKHEQIPFTILGNPFHLDDKTARRLKEHGCEKYQMSLDGMRDTHDWFRKPGSFDATLDKIACLKKAGIRTVIMSTVSGTNIHEIPDVMDTVVAHDVDVFAFARYCPTSAEKETGMTPAAYSNLLDICHRKNEENVARGVNTYLSRKDHLWTLYFHEQGLFQIPQGLPADMMQGGCNCGNCHQTILPNGDIHACRRLESKVGSVFGDRLSDVWAGKGMEAYREYNLFKKCSKCELLRFCRGCPAVAYGTTGDFYGEDPQCWKEVTA